MSRMIVGGFSGEMFFHFPDFLVRSIHAAVSTWYQQDNQGFFFKSIGEVDGKKLPQLVWISKSMPLRFEYDGDDFPDYHEGLVQSFLTSLNEWKAIEIPDMSKVGPADD